MIISPPFLPEVGALDEAAWLDAAMAAPLSKLQDTLAPEGSFPLSRGLAWHNGVHIQAPKSAAGAFLPVRAIADGRVVFVHEPTKPQAHADHPLNYNPFGSPPAPAWTSDGFVVIEHTTEIGAAGTTPTEIRYFSAYMHLASLADCPRRKAPWQAGDAIHRKDELGAPGAIYGHAGQIHFEICCDEAQLHRILGRAPEASDPLEPATPTADGRTDSVFGSLHVYLPAGTPTRSAEPVEHLRPSVVATASATATAASTPPGQVAPDTLALAQWVSITCDKGSATVASHDRLGQPIGTAPPETDFEYNLYAEANRRHDSLYKGQPAQPTQPVAPAAPASSGASAAAAATATATAAAPAAAAGSMPPPPSSSISSSPSGWYELLRFGRKLGPDPLPNAAAHWRRIATPQGLVWADLNAPGTFKFSDADFLPALGWHCFGDDATPTDQRCDSLRLKRLISDRDPANPNRLTTEHLVKRLGRDDVRALLRRAICKFPSEWDQRDIEARYGWLTTVDEQASDDDASAIRKWQRFVAHARALSFPDLPADFLQAQWRFHPREFIGVMRKCGWLSRGEFSQIYPNSSYSQRETPDPAALRERFLVSINRVTRKYFITTGTRLSHFFGQAAVESSFLARMVETSVHPARNPTHASVQAETSSFYKSESDNYFDQYDYRLGNVNPGDGMKFRGRGMKQLTGMENYSKYWVYRAWISANSFDSIWWISNAERTSAYKNPRKRHPDIPDPQRLSADHWSCVDAGAWYWEAGSARARFKSINRQIKEGDVSNEAIRRVTLAINGGENALPERQERAKLISKILMDK